MIDIITYLQKNVKQLKGRLYLENTLISPANAYEFIDFSSIEGSELADPKGFFSFINSPKSHQRREIKAFLLKFLRDTTTRSENNEENVELSWDYKNYLKYMPIADWIQKDNIYLYDTTTKQISDLNYQTWKRIIPPDITKDIHCVPGLCAYSPLNLERQWVEAKEGIEVLHLNSHIAPAWRYEDRPLAQCPELIKRFLLHLFPDKECRKYALNWVRNAILAERNGTYLILNAGKGVGKNLFVGLCKSLVGANNFEMASTGFLESNFNSVLLNRRLICLDEFSIDSKEKLEKIKRYVNAAQNIEKKGVDADRTQMTFNSFIICNNRGSDMKIEHDDRRFSPMEVTEIDLSLVMGKSDRNTIDQLGRIEEFRGGVQKKLEDMISQFGHWIIQNCEDTRFDVDTPWKGQRFLELVESSLWNWQRFIVDKIVSKEEKYYDYDTLKYEFENSSKYRDRFPNVSKVKDFVNCYKVNDGRIGSVDKDNITGKYLIHADKRFRPEEKINNLVTDVL